MKTLTAANNVVTVDFGKKKQGTKKLNKKKVAIASIIAVLILAFASLSIVKSVMNLATSLEVKSEQKLTAKFNKEVKTGKWNEKAAIEAVSSTYLGLDIAENSKPEKFDLKKSDYQGYGFVVYLNETHPTYGSQAIKVWLYYNKELGKFVPQFKGL